MVLSCVLADHMVYVDLCNIGYGLNIIIDRWIIWEMKYFYFRLLTFVWMCWIRCPVLGEKNTVL